MDFSVPKEYLEYKERVTAFAQQELNEDIVTRDHESQ